MVYSMGASVHCDISASQPFTTLPLPIKITSDIILSTEETISEFQIH